MRRKLGVLLVVLLIASMLAVPVSAQTAPDQSAPTRQLPAGLQPVTADQTDGATFGRIPSRAQASAPARYVVRFADPSLAQIALNAQQRGTAYDATTAAAHKATLLANQAQASAVVSSLGGKTLGNFTKLINGIAVEISPSRVKDLYAISGVVKVQALNDYALDLDETVPWIGAADVQAMGFDGTGIKVAVIDSGIDYTHEHLGGSGLQSDTDQALAEASQPADPDLFPTAKVIGGYDFVGSSWPNTAEIPDSNPMDDEAGSTDGHGTHVASIIGGVATESLGPGVAPGVEFYALKVCSSVSTSCSGLALMNSYEWAADPNGDGVFTDRADVVNLSLGSSYGQTTSADSDAMEMLVGVGSVVVASAGNSANMPYITGAPSSARSAISVAQTTVPSAILYRIRRNTPAPVTVMDAVWQPWSEFPTVAITGDVVYGNGDGTNLDGCAAFTADLTGKISIVNRGSCNFSLKTQNAEAAGAIMSIIALIAPGDPFEGAFGGGTLPTIPAFMVSQTNGNALKAAGTNLSIDPTDPAITIPLLDVMVGSSSRGPAFDANYLKPNIGAPGASVSASSGDQGYSVFGGTSGASPMVAGSAALVLDAAGGSASLPPIVVKALLMNTAETQTWQNFPGGMLNPISRQGAGRVDVAAAVEADTFAWVPADNDVALSFGFQTVTGDYMDSKTVEVNNTYTATKTYDIAVTYRYANDENAGVSIMADAASITVPAGGSAMFDVDLHVADPNALKTWPFTSGSSFANGDLLTGVEYDGYVTLTADDGEVTTIPWHFLPRAAADIALSAPYATSSKTYDVMLNNASPVVGAVEAYPLVDVSPQIVVNPAAVDVAPADLKYVGVDVYAWDATSNLLLFPITTWNSRSHPINAEFDVWIDINQDGEFDYVAYNTTLNGTTDPRPVSVLVNLATGTGAAQFYLDTTLNSDTMVLPVIVPDSDYALDFQVWTFDVYFTGDLWDTSPMDADEGAVHTFDGWAPTFTVDSYAFDAAANGNTVSTITAHPYLRSPSQTGMIYRVVNGDMGGEAFAVELPQPVLVSRSRRENVDRDTFISGVQPGTHFGSAQTMWAGFFGQMRPVVHTGMSSIPSDAVVDQAYLYLYVTEGRGFTNWGNSVIGVSSHAVDTEWMPVAVNWTMPWTMAGGDYGPALSNTHIGAGKLNTWVRFDVTAAVQDMMNGADNNGFIITNTDSTGVRYGFATKEYFDASKAGYMRVYFRTVP
ncbi:MAG: S8 family serine peptidase [Caldilineales bacterium]